ncbi:hypothetical protein DL95DRAFT_128745 [Leptodontidium sp. 2 PMI_412]|nr:hypothetical protein DL95DRAFT_128745 [Leptodontidium sp. 2 PMI_412]
MYWALPGLGHTTSTLRQLYRVSICFCARANHTFSNACQNWCDFLQEPQPALSLPLPTSQFFHSLLHMHVLSTFPHSLPSQHVRLPCIHATITSFLSSSKPGWRVGQTNPKLVADASLLKRKRVLVSKTPLQDVGMKGSVQRLACFSKNIRWPCVFVGYGSVS